MKMQEEMARFSGAGQLFTQPALGTMMPMGGQQVRVVVKLRSCRPLPLLHKIIPRENTTRDGAGVFTFFSGHTCSCATGAICQLLCHPVTAGDEIVICTLFFYVTQELKLCSQHQASYAYGPNGELVPL